MGFFKQDVVTTWVTAVDLMDKDKIPNSLKEAILYAIYNDESIPDHVIAANIKGFHSDVQSLWNYAKLGDDTNGAKGYFLGLPEGTKNYGRVKEAEVKKVLEQNIGEPITIKAINLGSLDIEFYGIYYTQTYYTWDFTRGGVVGFLSHPFDVYKITSVKYTQITIPYFPYTKDDTTRFDITLEATINPGDGSGNYKDKVVLRRGVPTGEVYYQVTYVINSNPPHVVRYALYDPTTKQYPSLNIPKGTQIKEFYPIVPLRIDTKNIDDWANQLEGESRKIYDTGSKLLNKIKVNADDIIDAVSNPDDPKDLEDISDVYFIFGVDIYSQIPEEMEYLFEFFKEMGERAGIDKDEYYASAGVIFQPGGGYRWDFPKQASTNSIVTKDSYYETILQYNFIETTIKQGVMSKVDGFTNSVTVLGNIIKSVGDKIINDGDINPDWIQYEYIQSYVTLTKQITANSYIEVKISGLIHKSRILKVVTGRDVISALTWDTDIVKTGSFFIPVNHTLLRKFNGTTENIILYNAMKLVIYSVKITALKWYQTDNFATLITVVSIFVGGYNFGMALQSVSSGLTAAAANAAVMTFVGKVVISAFVLDYAVTWVLENIGGDLGLAIAIGLSLAAGYMLASSSATMMENVLKAVSAVSNAYTKQQAIEMREMAEEYGEFKEAYESEMEYLKEAQELLKGFGPLDNPLMFMNRKPHFDLNQSPDEFYNQKLEQDPGAITLDLPELFYEDALKLPKLGYDNTLPPQ